MTAWSPKKITLFKERFYDFLNQVTINSKDRGPMILGQHLFEAQHRYFDAVFEALSEDIHDIKHLKSRQLGISTASRAFMLFWIGMFDGLKGYMILDTGEHKDEARLEIEDMVRNLPKDYDFPGIEISNRNTLKLTNQSTVIFTSAGIRETKASGGLGRGSGVNFVWASEVCSWNNIEGFESFRNSLSTEFENRLYLYESTGRGFNQWYKIWNDAKRDPLHQKTHFTGWWGKNSQKIPRSHPDFAKYAFNPLSVEEKERVADVKERYGWEISLEQIAWWRRHIDPASYDNDEASAVEADSLQLIEQPWTEDDAFASSNSIFFDPKVLTKILKEQCSHKCKQIAYYPGYSFIDMRVGPAPNRRTVMLKIWEEPDPDGVYIVSVDPAFGANASNDRSAIQVLRAYGDGLDQVAEYAWPLITTEQLTWVIAHLLGWYKNCYFVCELNGPGDAVWRGFKTLKKEVQQGFHNGMKLNDDFENIFSNVRSFIWQRSDSMMASMAMQIKTNSNVKVTIMEKTRDFLSNGMLTLKSFELLEELQSIERNGDEISAAGALKDDRVLALAFGVHYWQDSVRLRLSNQRITREGALAKRRLSIRDMYSMFTSYTINDFFSKKEEARKTATRALRRQSRGRLR